ncbi:MAG: bifunctional glutamate N-acetyltransferase/amino-acid acetyltransferase ArgJ [Proteobacteria bacterium]|nr:bifunctional glutamate N-acetyltransferase/amino-acid acetyltransferase ArgJ [Pseudomonadota bacterium]MBU1610719.1 bifunctional glutamate N-acetyltransferase/amino-acid acetyltransferase ArgJ [Pseudomonadota bacterium]
MTELPKGYRFAAVAAGFKKKDRLDLGVIVSDADAVAAGTFTRNIFTAAPVVRCKQLLAKRPYARAILVNSGQANACTGAEGDANCLRTQEMIAEAVGVRPEEVLVASTGVIGAQLKMDLWAAAMPLVRENLGASSAADVSRAIMTTDTVPKTVGVEVELSSGPARLFGMAKGAGMICPDMATLLGFIICDAEVDADWWGQALVRCVNISFNRITVDGDTSTNDTILALANGAAGVRAGSDADREALESALCEICRELAYKIVQDAEGGTKVARIRVAGASDAAQAELAARAIGHSPLVKTALFGCDPNWGRIVAAAGRSGALFRAEDLVLKIGGIVVFEKGQPAPGDMDSLLAPIMNGPDIEIVILLGEGGGGYELAASDLSRDYVSINADYRS